MAQRVDRGIALLFHYHGRTLPPGKSRYPLYKRLGGTQDRSGLAENLAPPGFDTRTVQPVVNRYTDWSTRPTFLTEVGSINPRKGLLCRDFTCRWEYCFVLGSKATGWDSTDWTVWPRLGSSAELYTVINPRIQFPSSLVSKQPVSSGEIGYLTVNC